MIRMTAVQGKELFEQLDFLLEVAGKDSDLKETIVDTIGEIARHAGSESPVQPLLKIWVCART